MQAMIPLHVDYTPGVHYKGVIEGSHSVVLVSFKDRLWL